LYIYNFIFFRRWSVKVFRLPSIYRVFKKLEDAWIFFLKYQWYFIPHPGYECQLAGEMKLCLAGIIKFVFSQLKEYHRYFWLGMDKSSAFWHRVQQSILNIYLTICIIEQCVDSVRASLVLSCIRFAWFVFKWAFKDILLNFT